MALFVGTERQPTTRHVAISLATTYILFDFYALSLAKNYIQFTTMYFSDNMLLYTRIFEIAII